MHPPLLVITGPTASGKSSLALHLARRLRDEGRSVEFVCCDSMQIYRGLDIGTAKPSAEERQEFPHHMLDLIGPEDRFSVGDYCRLAHPILRGIHARGALPILVGGTGLYLRGLLYGIVEMEDSLQEKLDREIARLRESSQTQILSESLAAVDAVSAARIHPNDRFRLTRALAFYNLTKSPFSEYQRAHGFREQHYTASLFAIDLPRDVLYERIDQRLANMLGQGLIAELRQTLAAGVPETARALQGLAYRWFLKSLTGEMSEAEALALTQRDSRRYAKRQLTWFRPLTDLRWLPHSLSQKDQEEVIMLTLKS